MNNSEKVTAYIKKHDRWRLQLEKLREAFQESDLLEEVKWGSPTYTMDGKLVAGFANMLVAVDATGRHVVVTQGRRIEVFRFCRLHQSLGRSVELRGQFTILVVVDGNPMFSLRHQLDFPDRSFD